VYTHTQPENDHGTFYYYQKNLFYRLSSLTWLSVDVPFNNFFVLSTTSSSSSSSSCSAAALSSVCLSLVLSTFHSQTQQQPQTAFILYFCPTLIIVYSIVVLILLMRKNFHPRQMQTCHATYFLQTVSGPPIKSKLLIENLLHITTTTMHATNYNTHTHTLYTENAHIPFR